MGADFLAIFWAANCFRGTFWAVDFLAVCLVRAISNKKYDEMWKLTNGVKLKAEIAHEFLSSQSLIPSKKIKKY